MKLDRFRAPVLAATAVLMISGAGIAFAGNPSTVALPSVIPAAQTEPTGPDSDTLQQGDQTTPDTAPIKAVAATGVSAVPDTDTVEQGAQTSSDVVDAKSKASAAETSASETSIEGSAGNETPDSGADGPGGHSDPAGQNVDHQFNGQE